jgi:hypothetical protein
MRIKRALIAALVVGSFPAAAFAAHFCTIHTLSWIPSAENILFLEGFSEPNIEEQVPSSEEYLLDQMSEYEDPVSAS